MQRFRFSQLPSSLGSLAPLALATGLLAACGSIESTRHVQPKPKPVVADSAESTSPSADADVLDPVERTDAQVRADELLDHAVGQIQASLEGLESARQDLEQSTAEIKDQRSANIAEWELAKERMNTLREGFREASSSSKWPATIEGDTFEREDLVQEASSNLAHEQTLASLVATQDDALAEADKALSSLGQEVVRLRKELAAIAESREAIQWDELSPAALEAVEAAAEIPDIEPTPIEVVAPAPKAPATRLGRGQHE